MEDVNTQCLKWRPEKIRLISKELSVLGITMSILLFAITTSSVTAQNAIQPSLLEMRVHQLIKFSEVGQNMSTAVSNAGQAKSNHVRTWC